MREKARSILQKGTVIPALPLVLREDRSFDEAGQRRLIRYYLEAGAGGLAVAVHTTQFEIRQPAIGLFEPLIRIARQEIGRFEQKTGKTVVCVCGICGPKEVACREAELAKEAGYDAVLLSPNGLNDLSEAEHLQRAEAVSEILPVIGFYLQTAVGGRRFSYDYWQKLCRLKGVAAIKAAPFNRYQTLDIVRAVADSGRKNELALYTGNDDNIVSDLLTEFEVGGEKIRFSGGLLGHWAVWTHSAVRLYERICREREAGQISAELLTIAAQVTDCNAAFFDTANAFSGCITGIHEVLRQQGLMPGIWTLQPEESLSPGQAEEIDRVWRSYPHLADDEFVRQFLQREKEEEID